MKKVIASSLALAMLLGLSSCGDSTNEQFESNQRASMEAEKARSTTEPTTSNVVQYDPLENVTISFSDWTDYPKYANINFDYDFEDNKEKKCINSRIVSADSDSVVVEVSVDKEAVADFFGDTPYNLVDDKKEYTFKANKDFMCRLLDSKRLNEEDICKMNNEYKSATERVNSITLELAAIYASELAQKETYLTDYPIVANGKVLVGLDSVGIEDISKTSIEPYKLWFIYKTSDNSYLLMDSWNFKYKEGLCDYKLSDAYVSEPPTYKTLEEAKRIIENNIAKYENIKLTEIPIPESLK